MLNTVIPIFSSAGAGAAGTAYESIATVTVGSGGAANVEFTSIPNTYSHLQIRGIARSAKSASDDNLGIRFNSDSGSNYTSHFIYGDGANADVGAVTAETRTRTFNVSAASATANIFGAGVIDILDYNNSNKYKTVRTLSGNDRNGAGIIIFRSGLWLNTNAINSITIVTLGGDNITQYSHFALYGIKSA